MSKPKLTPWFSAVHKPVRVGVYQTSYRGDWGAGFSYWDGSRWGNQKNDPKNCHAGDFIGAYQNKQWRGFAEEPKP